MPPLPLSVAIPTRDRPEFLAETIKSVIHGSALPENIYVVDNSQNDPGATQRVCESFGSRVTYVGPIANLSFQANHNRALRLINSEFSGLLHDDDVYGEHFLEKGYAALRSNPAGAFFAVNYSVIDPEGVQTQPYAWSDFNEGQFTSSQWLRTVMRSRSQVHFSAAILRTSFSHKCELSEQDSHSADLGFFVRLACFGHVILANEALVSIRVHAEMESARTGYFGSVGARTSSELRVVPLEWQTKNRFLCSELAALTLGADLPELRTLAGRSASRQILRDLLARGIPSDERIALVRALAEIANSARPRFVRSRK